jgi:23S rRNA (guanosine2251-2'-O)-methyltransferase
MSEILYGRRPVLEVLRDGGRPILKVYLMKGGRDEMFTQVEAHVKTRGIPCFYETRHKLDVLAKTDKHQGVVAVLESRKFAQLEDLLDAPRQRNEPLFAVVLDGIEDPQNLGAILRSADAAGVHGVVIPKDRSADVTAAASKASAGAAEHVLTVRVVNLNDALRKMKAAGAWVYGADAEGKKPFYEADLRRPCALVIGGEGKGLRRLVRENCDELVSIPMSGKVASLNASVAAALMMFEVARQRRWKIPGGAFPTFTSTSSGYPPVVYSTPSYAPSWIDTPPIEPRSGSPPDRSFFRPGPDPAPETPVEGPDETMNGEPSSTQDLPGNDKGGHFQW